MLNPQSPIPLYRQLADRLSAMILAGELAAGDRVPSEHQLAADFGIGRPTARQAIDVLVRKGLLKRRRGSGTFVREPRPDVDLFSLDGTSASFMRKGVRAQTRILSPLGPPEQITGCEDNPFHDRRAYFLARLTSVQSIPVLAEDIYLDPGLFNGIERFSLERQSLSAIAEAHFFLRPTGGKQRFRIGYATGAKALHLQVSEQTPLLVVQRFLHFPQKENGVFSQLWCRGDHFTFSQTLGGSADA